MSWKTVWEAPHKPCKLYWLAVPIVFDVTDAVTNALPTGLGCHRVCDVKHQPCDNFWALGFLFANPDILRKYLKYQKPVCHRIKWAWKFCHQLNQHRLTSFKTIAWLRSLAIRQLQIWYSPQILKYQKPVYHRIKTVVCPCQFACKGLGVCPLVRFACKLKVV